jgi:hypothetical protein
MSSRPRLLLRSFHQYSRHAGHAATRKICQEIKHHFDGVTGRRLVPRYFFTICGRDRVKDVVLTCRILQLDFLMPSAKFES